MRMFGGHEVKGSVQCEREAHVSHMTCCVAGELRNPEACQRAHWRDG